MAQTQSRHGAGTAQARRRHGAGTAQARRRLQRRRLNGANGPKSKKKIVVPWRLCSSMGLCSSTGVNAVSWGLCSSMDVMQFYEGYVVLWSYVVPWWLCSSMELCSSMDVM